ncbi:MAG: hypothetical protein ACK5Q5_01965 [Planctomycetaceae bacterium]
MTCHEFRSRLEHAIETRDAAALSELAEHGIGCAAPDCQSLWQDELLLADAIPAWRAQCVLPETSLVRRTLANLSSPATAVGAVSPKALQPRQSWLPITAAAAILLVVGLSLQRSDDAQPVAIAVHPAVSPATTLEGQQTDYPGRKLPLTKEADHRESYVHLAHEATYFMTDLAMAVVPVEVDPSAGNQQTSWFTQLGERLEPVRSDVEVKFDEWFGPPMT